MLKLSLDLVSLLTFSLISLVRPQNLSKIVRTAASIEKIDYLTLENAIICKFQPNGYDCDGNNKVYPKFYYDLKLENCKTFNIGTCPNNLNAYENLNDCHHACRDVGTQAVTRNLSTRIFCRLQEDFGYCNEYHPRWYYDLTTRTCKGFSYSGCGGNLNRFISQEACVSTCVALGQSGFH